MGDGEIMPQKQYLDPNTGEPVTTPESTPKTYLDDNGEIKSDIPYAPVSQNRGTIPSASSYGAGFMRSVLEDITHIPEQLGRYAKGAIANLPGALMNAPGMLLSGLAGAGDADTSNFLTREEQGLPPAKSLGQVGSEINQWITQNPGDFAELMGELTGQPLATEGLIKGVTATTPPIVRGAGAVAQGAGKMMSDYSPISTTMGATAGFKVGGVPGAIYGATYKPLTRFMRNMEGAAGEKLQDVGARMRNFGKAPIQGEVLPPDVMEGDFTEIPPDRYKVIRGEGPVPGTFKELPALASSNTEFRNPPDIQVGQDLRTVVPNSNKPKVRRNPDGTFTDLKTGEVLDNKGQSIIEINGKPVVPKSKEELQNLPEDLAPKQSYSDYVGGKPIDRNSPFFTKNRKTEIGDFFPDDVSHARTMEIDPSTGRPYIYAGGADPRVLDVLATSLYTKSMPETVAKELLQNSLDEMKITGNQSPIKVALSTGSKHPITGADSPSITVADSGRGLGPEELYTIFSDVGKTGKGNESTASGGFGFAKAAPLLGGDYVEVTSVVNEGGKKVQYSFKGTPQEINAGEKSRVSLPSKVVDPSTPTGFKVRTYFPKEARTWGVEKLVKQIVTNSPNARNVHYFEDYSAQPHDLEHFLGGKARDKYVENAVKQGTKILNGETIPSKQATLKTPNADIDIHFDLDDKERKSGTISYLNNGMFTSGESIGYAMEAVPHVPPKIVVDIRPTVEEGTRGYPFGTNREAISEEVKGAITEWISENIKKPAANKALNEIQRLYDSLKPAPGNKHIVFDPGGRYTPEEMKEIETSPHLNKVANVMGDFIEQLSKHFEGKTLGDVEKYGFQLTTPGQGGLNLGNPKVATHPNLPIVDFETHPLNINTQSGSLGTRLRNASNQGKALRPFSPKFSIMIDPFGSILNATNPNNAAQRMVHIMLHEFNHNFVRSEGAGFTWNLAGVETEFPLEKRVEFKNAIRTAITDAKGNYVPEIQKLLRRYQEAGRRSATKDDILGRQRESEWLRGKR